MKKLSIFVLVLFVVCMAGCSQKQSGMKNQPDAVDLSRVLEIDDQYLRDLKENIVMNHSNTICDELQISIKEDIQETMLLKICGIQYELNYKDTIYLPIRSLSFHRFTVNGNENDTILLDDNGNVKMLLFNFSKIDVQKGMLKQEAIENLKSELAAILDISFYKNVKVISGTGTLFGESMGLNDYRFYNEVDGYITDFMDVSIDDEGLIHTLKIYDFLYNDPKVHIDKEKEKVVIEAKLKDIYDTDDSRYQNYEMACDPFIVLYEDQVYIEYYINAYYKLQSIVGTTGDMIRILIPMEIISD